MVRTKVRTKEDWEGILSSLEPEVAARRILGDITHYREGCNHEREDRQQLAAALEAWATLRK